jgi:hypothetical protein
MIQDQILSLIIHHHYALRDLGPVACSGLNVMVQKSLQWATWVPLSCWLVFHNSAWELTSVHSANMFYPFVFVIVDSF